jgi:hypothetical protein
LLNKLTVRNKHLFVRKFGWEEVPKMKSDK